jgi:hypothetical protein
MKPECRVCGYRRCLAKHHARTVINDYQFEEAMRRRFPSRGTALVACRTYRQAAARLGALARLAAARAEPWPLPLPFTALLHLCASPGSRRSGGLRVRVMARVASAGCARMDPDKVDRCEGQHLGQHLARARAPRLFYGGSGCIGV